MKRHLFVWCIILFLGRVAMAQDDCETGFCPPSVTVHHYGGSVAPVDATITYEVVESSLSGNTRCWIARNLGASSAPSSSTVSTAGQSGWYWQFNRKQGYSHNGTSFTPVVYWKSSISETSNWTAGNDPCTLLLGDTWSIPTYTQWSNVISNASWGGSVSNSFGSVLKIHTGAGKLSATDGSLSGRGSNGWYWSATSVNYTTARAFNTSTLVMEVTNKPEAYALRCIRTY